MGRSIAGDTDLFCHSSFSIDPGCDCLRFVVVEIGRRGFVVRELDNRECVRATDRPTFGDLAVTGDEKNEIPIFIGPGAIVLAAAKLRKCLRHVFIFGFAGSGTVPKLKRSSCHSTSQIR